VSRSNKKKDVSFAAGGGKIVMQNTDKFSMYMMPADSIECHPEDSHKIRPCEDVWDKFRILDPTSDPDSDEGVDFQPWPLDDEGERDFIQLLPPDIMYLQHENGRITIYTNNEFSYSLYHKTVLNKKRKVNHQILSVRGLSFLHRRRAWLETSSGIKFYLGGLSEGDSVYITDNNTEIYTLKMDDVCQALLTRK
jgi:hypothetical protein